MNLAYFQTEMLLSQVVSGSSVHSVYRSEILQTDQQSPQVIKPILSTTNGRTEKRVCVSVKSGNSMELIVELPSSGIFDIRNFILI